MSDDGNLDIYPGFVHSRLNNQIVLFISMGFMNLLTHILHHQIAVEFCFAFFLHGIQLTDVSIIPSAKERIEKWLI
jgi:hypothetical protein